MSVAPHPHTGLQTVSWLFTGEIEHRDSAGHHAFVRPGELNLMTAGRGISHSEVSTPRTTTLHGAQLWVALPESALDSEPTFEHFAPEPFRTDGVEGRVFLGSLLGHTSPVATHTPLLGAELVLRPGAEVQLDVDPTFEHGVLVDTGDDRRLRRDDRLPRPRLRPARIGLALPGRRRRRSPCPVARWSAVRRGDRHVVELRRPHPRRRRRPPRRLADPARAGLRRRPFRRTRRQRALAHPRARTAAACGSRSGGDRRGVAIWSDQTWPDTIRATGWCSVRHSRPPPLCHRFVRSPRLWCRGGTVRVGG